jgi:glycosyltransferase involved in cell wall biosynthesis
MTTKNTMSLKLKPTVEVLVCTFNGEKYLQSQLDSIIKQSYSVDKISIYDDGSTDCTVQLIESFARNTDGAILNLSVRLNPINLGWIENFAQAIRNSTCDIIFLCDQDDIWQPQKVEKLVAALEDTGVDLAFSDGALIDHLGEPIGTRSMLQLLDVNIDAMQRDPKILFFEIQKANFISGASLAMRSTVAKAALPAPKGMNIDYWLGLESCAKDRVKMVAEKLYSYRQHGKNVIGLKPRSTLESLSTVWKQPFSNRKRELDVWAQLAPRLHDCVSPENADFLSKKLAFLTRSVGYSESFFGRLKRFLLVLKYWGNGDYRKYSGPDALWADVFAAIRRR